MQIKHGNNVTMLKWEKLDSVTLHILKVWGLKQIENAGVLLLKIFYFKNYQLISLVGLKCAVFITDLNLAIFTDLACNRTL